MRVCVCLLASVAAPLLVSPLLQSPAAVAVAVADAGPTCGRAATARHATSTPRRVDAHHDRPHIVSAGHQGGAGAAEKSVLGVTGGRPPAARSALTATASAARTPALAAAGEG